MAEKKQCYICFKEKSLDDFYKNSRAKDGYDCRCKQCIAYIKRTYRNVKKPTKKYDILCEVDESNPDWQVGKYSGYILQRKNDPSTYCAILHITPKNQISKNFKIADYASESIAYKEAQYWLYVESTKQGLTSNMIKVIDKDTIVVKLTQDAEMKTDIKFADIIQKHKLFADLRNGDLHAKILINTKEYLFENIITGYNHTYHLNSDTLDNRERNLFATNQHKKQKVYFSSKTNEWVGIAYMNNTIMSLKGFSVEEYGYKKAKHFAIDYHKDESYFDLDEMLKDLDKQEEDENNEK